MANVNGMYGEKVWEEKIKSQDEIGVIAGTVSSIEEIKRRTVEGMKLVDHSVIPLIKKKGRVLDLGVGPLARFAIEFSKRGYKVFGMDISETTLEYAKRNIEKESLKIDLVKEDITKLNMPEGKFDLIYCLATFYHVPPHLAGISLLKINQKLNPGGYALIEFGLLQKKKAKDYFWSPIYWVGHYFKRLIGQGFNVNVSRFNRREINEMLDRSGFKVIEVLKNDWY